ncbi:MAG TPA: xanthine dehydrogenase family protein, partial [Beijerinckiaceae bacterium]|nr:xanthine dehydrogenase family protein [Beijerinckiaceae bacterium]
MAWGGIGDAVLRKEDARLVTGAGRFGDDEDILGAAHAFFIRSPHPHARLLRVDASGAGDVPGLIAVLTGADVVADGLQPIPHGTGNSRMGSDVALRQRDGSERLTTRHMPLPTDAVRYVGEAVALVVAQTLAAAKDAAERVRIDYEALPAVARARDALAADAPEIWRDVPQNLALDAEAGDRAATDAAFETAAHRVSLRTWVQRVTGVHMEPRTIAAEWDEATGSLIIRASHGIGVHQLRQDLAAVLRVPPELVRVVAPQDVGGNFGTRNATYVEMAAVAWAARRLRRSVRHTAERQEAFLSDFQGRDLEVEAELALDKNGSFLALRASNVSNLGAHTASFVALNKGLQLMSGTYRIPVGHYRARAALTNTPSTIPYRSAGRPEAIFVIERLIDLAARQCGFDRVELRRRNLVRADEMPYRNPAGVTYDNGDYRAVMERAMELADWSGFPQRRADSQSRGLCRGISVSTYVETTSGNPRERADITIAPEGGVDVVIGTQSTGQGHETSFSQLVADWLGVPFECVTIRAGDTAFVKAGG